MLATSDLFVLIIKNTIRVYTKAAVEKRVGKTKLESIESFLIKITQVKN